MLNAFRTAVKENFTELLISAIDSYARWYTILYWN